tara:strand:+ start:3001 stop:3165 length:165 start_codon:yes stop_codon:yes gene_type:complete
MFKCTICKADADIEEGGIEKCLLGMIEASFCVFCLSSIIDMMGYLETEKHIKRK